MSLAEHDVEPGHASCPPIELLVRLASATGSTAEYASVNEHVDHCKSCQQRIDEILSGRFVVKSDLSFENDASVNMPASDWPDIPGFVIEAKLGQGGMSKVYRACTLASRHVVALKVMNGGATVTQDDRLTLLREANLLAKIAPHANVVRYLYVASAGELVYLVLELVNGGSLSNLPKGSISARDAARLVMQVALGVDHVHAQGLYHLDIKPSNILLEGTTQAGTAKLTDFGIARVIERIHEGRAATVAQIGTLRYMAPEQYTCESTKLGPWTDVYGLGATLYELLTGSSPFGSLPDKLVAHSASIRDPTFPRRLNPNVPRDLETICLKCIEREPSTRYHSASALATDLKNWLDGLPISVRAASPGEVAWKWAKRRPVVAGLLLTIVLLMIGSSAGFAWLWRRAEAERATVEIGYKQMSETLDRLTSSTLKNFDISKDFEYHQSILEAARAQEIQSRQRHPEADPWRLATIDAMLGGIETKLGHSPKAIELLSEGIELYEQHLRMYPDDLQARLKQFELLFNVGGAQSGNGSKWIAAWSEQVQNIAFHLRGNEKAIGVFARLSTGRGDLADTLFRGDDHEWPVKLLTADLEILDSLTPLLKANPRIIVRRYLTRDWLGLEADNVQDMKRIIHEEEGSPYRVDVDFSLAQLFAGRCGWAGGWRPLSQSFSVELMPREWSERLLRLIQDEFVHLGRDPKFIPSVCWEMHTYASKLAAHQRRQDPPGAVVTTARLWEVANRMVELYPNDPKSFLLQSEAYTQLSKNAFRDLGGKPEECLHNSLVAARKAVALEPEDPNFIRYLELRRQRLDKFREGR